MFVVSTLNRIMFQFQMISTITLLIIYIASGPGRRRIATTKVQYGYMHSM